jgi:hypothetical protein
VAGFVKIERPGVTICGRNCHISRENEGPTRTEAKKTPFRRGWAVVTIRRPAKKPRNPEIFTRPQWSRPTKIGKNPRPINQRPDTQNVQKSNSVDQLDGI